MRSTIFAPLSGVDVKGTAALGNDASKRTLAAMYQEALSLRDAAIIAAEEFLMFEQDAADAPRFGESASESTSGALMAHAEYAKAVAAYNALLREIGIAEGVHGPVRDVFSGTRGEA